MHRTPIPVTLIGYGAIGRAVVHRTQQMEGIRISHLVVSSAKRQETQSQVGPLIQVVDQVPADARLVLECAGHSALTQHVLPALARGVECAIVSIGALSEPGMPDRLHDAAMAGRTQVHLLPGAIGAIDALAAARLAGLDAVQYVGRKPPAGWRGTPAQQCVDLDALTQPTVILDASARDAARLYPKNANVAAMVSLAGVGLDATRVILMADPTLDDNVHEVRAQGAFGELHLSIRGKPLADNPKTSTLTVFSVLRFLHNQCSPVRL